MTQLDSIDRKLLYELDGNSRQSTSQLARSLKQGRDRIEYRLERLKKTGVLRSCTVTINPFRLGLTLYKTYLKLEKKRNEYEKVISFLNRHPRIYWIADCDGKWDLIFSTFARSAFEFHVIQHQILSRFSELIVSADVYTLVNIWMHRKGYLVSRGSPYFYIGGEPANHSPDKLEWDILKILSHDSRKNVAEIANLLNTTVATVRYRIEQLETVGLIAGYRVELDHTALKMMHFKAQLYLRDYSLEFRKRLRSFSSQHPHITYFIEQLGECTLELELEVLSYQQYTEIINSIREKFGESIRNIETVLIQRSWFKWVPYDLAVEIKTAYQPTYNQLI